MKDTVLKGTGSSRYLKSVENFKTLYPTYDDFAAALVAGTLPIDLNGINAAGMEQIGTALNKANLLTDETAALMDLDETGTVNEMFSALVDDRIWFGQCTSSESEQNKVVNIPGLEVTLGTKIRVHFSSANYASGTKLNVNGTGAKSIYTKSSYGSSGSGSLVPERGYWVAGEVLDFIYNGYGWLVVHGVKRSVYGSYTGTGTYGASAQTELRFQFPPRFVLVKGLGATPWAIFVCLDQYGTSTKSSIASSSEYVNQYAPDNYGTISWYNATDAAKQFNSSGATYMYVAFG